MLVDSHCHLDRLDLSQTSLEGVLEFAHGNGVGAFLCVCINRENYGAVVELAERHPEVYASAGIHPNEEEVDEPSLADLITMAGHPEVVAVGETGLDFYRTTAGEAWQLERFRRHIAAARQVGKPLIIHSREAASETLRLMQEERAAEVGGVMHCFVDDWETAQAALELGFYISISGIVTFNNAAQVRDVATRVPLDRLLVETDAPYLTPAPHRGKPNQPAYVHFVAERVARERGMAPEELAQATTENFYRLFPLAQRPQVGPG